MNAAQKLFAALPDAASITALVGRTEDTYLEVKTCSAPFSDDDKDNLAKAVAGFANAAGGILIFGLQAKGGDRLTPDKIGRVVSVQNLELALSTALALVGQVVEPPVEGVIVESRELQRAPGTGFIVVFVPPSSLGPHRSKRDREYYRRHGSSTLPMEHYEIAEMFGRRHGAKLSFWSELQPGSHTEGNTSYCEFIIGLQNDGLGLGRFPCLTLGNMPTAKPSNFGLDGNGRTGLPVRASGDWKVHIFAGGSDEVVYPRSRLPVTRIRHYWGSSAPIADFKADIEILADNMEPVRESFLMTGDDIRKYMQGPR